MLKHQHAEESATIINRTECGEVVLTSLVSGMDGTNCCATSHRHGQSVIGGMATE